MIEGFNLKANVGEMPLPDQTPLNKHVKKFSGSLRIHSDQTFSLDTKFKSWRLITLEPALKRWLESCKDQQNVHLLAVANPWGPWLRLIRILD